jgi:hypothetical protein
LIALRTLQTGISFNAQYQASNFTERQCISSDAGKPQSEASSNATAPRTPANQDPAPLLAGPFGTLASLDDDFLELRKFFGTSENEPPYEMNDTIQFLNPQAIYQTLLPHR